MAIYRHQRQHMVFGQLRPAPITNEALLSAFSILPRERFVRPQRRQSAYCDSDIRLARSRWLFAPATMARLLQSLALKPDMRVMVIPTASGYTAALCALLGAHTTAVDNHPVLSQQAQENWQKQSLTIHHHHGSLQDGCPQNAPYQRIIIEGFLPATARKTLHDQLDDNGKLVATEDDNTLVVETRHTDNPTETDTTSTAYVSRHRLGIQQAYPLFDFDVSTPQA
ncbi:MAG: hypothetical protein GDA50_03670 [Alphaproteobacteria bacterium GM202ARS2]|nr:hypothetical protein [Alphaproteobacteria bacterium GM202ARS2]